jgi:site-specific recombinase XerD
VLRLIEENNRCRLPALTWYQATRHTFASQFVLAGGSIEKLSKLMGHSSVTTTERYAHLRADLLAALELRAEKWGRVPKS